MPSWARTVVLVAVALAVWLVQRPASAAAPFCDDRGAIMLAPPPTLDTQDASIDVGSSNEGCFEHAGMLPGLDQGSRSDPAPAPQNVQTTLPAVDGSIPAADVCLVALCESAVLHRPGIRSRLERPPRA
jgi:hypothetical protein